MSGRPGARLRPPFAACGLPSTPSPAAAAAAAAAKPQAVFEKYMNHSDSTTRDRISFEAKLRAARAGVPQLPSPTGAAGADDPERFEPPFSGFSDSGWDKYHFFSSTGQGDTKGGIHMTARKGRARPAMTGAQTFLVDPFTPEDMNRIRSRGTDWNRTTYGECFGQLARIKAQAEEQAARSKKQSSLSAAGSQSLGNLQRPASRP